jgi:hypothetical protein
MQGVRSDYAAKQVQLACRERFPVKTKNFATPKKRIWAYEDQESFGPFAENFFRGGNLSNDEISRISGRIGINSSFFSNDTEIYGSLHNGNASVSANNIVINIWNKNRFYRYVLDLFIQPRKTERFSFPFDWPEDEPFEWDIYEVYGYKE